MLDILSKIYKEKLELCKNTQDCFDKIFSNNELFKIMLQSKEVLLSKELTKYLKTNIIDTFKLSEILNITKNYLSKDELFDFFKSQSKILIENFDPSAQELPKLPLEMCQYFFNDLKNNVHSNLNLILNKCQVNDEYKNSIKPEFYSLISDLTTLIDEMTLIANIEEDNFDYENNIMNLSERREEYFNKCLTLYIKLKELSKENNLNELVYDAIALARKSFAEELELRINNFANNIDSLDNFCTDGIKVYQLKGENFEILTHCITSSDYKNRNEEEPEKLAKEIYNDYAHCQKDYMCLSLWHQRHIKAIDNNVPVLGFFKIQPELLISASPLNGSSDFLPKEIRNSASRFPSSFTSVEDFINSTTFNVNNEIRFLTQDFEDCNAKLQPDFICSTNITPTLLDIELAKLFKVPIISINSMCYFSQRRSNVENEYQYL